ncbi:endonuclease/exonuclease/phosphatase family protein [Planctomycetes bacterium K23_9]|uniref:Endonuclease/exonuclease/phosphatase domain-containing protein n=1 Tax=Stieleria marina TaxID=1930275 RepID=A0A517P2G8_9BACT|nr:hypothetical protein K239x_55920 [Planctomycetes bacterium K23_9]
MRLVLVLIGTVLLNSFVAAQSPSTIRIATYNASLYGKKSGQILERLRDGRDQQAEKVARVVQTIRPDVLLINEIDYDADGATAKTLAELYFAKPQRKLSPIDYPYVYSVSSNTGVDSQLDLDQNGRTNGPADAWGFGVYPGQYSMAIYSRYPINYSSIRSFQKLLWKDLPDAKRPVDPKTALPYHDDELWNQLRLSSKNHVDVAIQIGETVLHVLACHPTPPVFDGPEDRNGCRNHDEIKFWDHYLSNPAADWLVDDQGNSGGLAVGESFVIMGDLNSDSVDGDGKRQAIVDLLANDRLYDPQPKSKGAVADSAGKKSAARQKADPALDTAKFGGNLRVDYVLPSRTLKRKDAGVVWPEKTDPDYEMITASDHRMVWVDVELQ